MNKRNVLLDLLKGGAIIVVILYHLGLLPYGYLGVELFLVISGYLTTKGVLKFVDKSACFYGYWQFINNRLVRLWPLLILVSLISLALGWMWMLPIHFKLNCESVIGSCTFTNNLVQLITTGNYWTSTNEYKPLMHTWYVAILFQFYVLYPFVFIFNKKFSKDWLYSSFVTLAILFALSLGLYLSSVFSTAQNFYLLPSRLFEFLAGGGVALYSSLRLRSNRRLGNVLLYLAIVIFIFLLLNHTLDANKTRLLVIVAVSTFLVYMIENGYNVSSEKWMRPLILAGAASYSLYLSHQVLFALYRYAFNDAFSVNTYVLLFIFSFTIGFIIYYSLEKPMALFVKGGVKRICFINTICVIFVLFLSSVSFYYYRKGGMVRDIPELEMFVDQKSETPEDYNGRTHVYNKDFEDNGKGNILVIGDSFGRDWINVLLESGIDSLMNISYCIEPDETAISRIKHADYVFIANNTYLSDRYGRLLPLVLTKKFYRVGRKSYGTWIGIVYNNDRYGKSYFDQLVTETEGTSKTNKVEKELYGEHFIDMMTPLKNRNGQISIFDDEHHLITQDGIHLTKAGAKKYAKILNIKELLK